VNFVPADYNAMRLAIASNPALFGFHATANGQIGEKNLVTYGGQVGINVALR
jgi:hypothetical protein